MTINDAEVARVDKVGGVLVKDECCKEKVVQVLLGVEAAAAKKGLSYR